MEVRGKKITVIGGARSGLAAARLLKRAGADVFLTDQGGAPDGAVERLQADAIAHEFGGHSARALDADFLVISPGVPSTADLVQEAIRRGRAVYSEIEVASWFWPAPIIAITGSNGKTTTTSLTAHVLRTAGVKHEMAGNIGVAFSDCIAGAGPETIMVLEVSSFQLDHIDRFRPKVSVLLNITPDHLDRYNNDFESYARSKYRIFENQGAGDSLVYNHDDERVRTHAVAHADASGATGLGFSLQQELDAGAFLREDTLTLRLGNTETELMDAGDLALPGRHNLYNSMAAALTGYAMNVQVEPIREALASFAGVPHRLEFVRELDEVRYVNDSKATNVDSVWYALQSFDDPIILIAGGRDKGNDYSTLKKLVRERVRAIIGIGESGEKVVRELGSEAPEASIATSLAEAVNNARARARKGDVVLLSPACASFDMFKSYEHRGESFKDLVMDLE